MAVRVRSNGRILCAATHPAKRGDTYLNDGLHYKLSVELRVLVTEPMYLAGGRGGHQAHGEWWWSDRVPDDVEIDAFYLGDSGGPDRRSRGPVRAIRASNIHESIPEPFVSTPYPTFKHCPGCGRTCAEKSYLKISLPDGSKGLSELCKRCEKRQEEIFEVARTAAAREPLRSKKPVTESTREARHRDRLRKYGLTPERYLDLVEEQDGRCAICRRVSKRELSIDHCHRTGPVRGLLCTSCNIGLGLFGDDPERLRAALAYLDFHSPNVVSPDA